MYSTTHLPNPNPISLFFLYCSPLLPPQFPISVIFTTFNSNKFPRIFHFPILPLLPSLKFNPHFYSLPLSLSLALSRNRLNEEKNPNIETTTPLHSTQLNSTASTHEQQLSYLGASRACQAL